MLINTIDIYIYIRKHFFTVKNDIYITLTNPKLFT